MSVTAKACYSTAIASPAAEIKLALRACGSCASKRLRRRGAPYASLATTLRRFASANRAGANRLKPNIGERWRFTSPPAMSRVRATTIALESELRLTQKYASALLFGREPERARGWFERALGGYRKAGISAKNASAAGTILLRLSRQYWLDADTIAALPLISEAIQLGTVAKDDVLSERANLAMAHYLILLGRHEAAEPFFQRAGNVLESDRPETRAVSLTQRAILYAAKGNKTAA